MENHPYLPADKQRGEEIDKSLDEVLKIDESSFIELDAEFKVNENQVPDLGHTEFLVKWIEK